jgi:pyrroline-5-carboxylate reductase
MAPQDERELGLMIALPTTWFVGCGQMAGALIEGWQKAGVDFGAAVAIRPSGRQVDGVRTLTAVPNEPSPLRCVLGFKPQLLHAIAPELATKLSSETVLVSMLAGVEAETLRARFPGVRSVVRTMPNLPAAERCGVTALFSHDADPELRQRMQTVVGLLGLAVWTDSEAELAAIGSVAGAGPAYVARFIAALAKAGEARGLDPELAARIALETVLGTARMAEARGESMAEVARRVASPKGTTEAGLAVLDQDKALDELIAGTIAAAARRGAELAQEARKP